MTPAKTVNKDTHRSSGVSSSSSQVPPISIDLIDESYNENEDPDFTLNQTTQNYSDEDEDDDEDLTEPEELESELSELNDDDDTSSVSSDFEKPNTLLDLQTKPMVPLSESTSTASLILETHKHFKTFVHKHEIPRKLFHVSIGFITLYLYTVNVQIEALIKPLSTMFVTVGSLDVIRFKYPGFNKLYCQFCGFLMREKEVNSYNGVIWYLLGLCIVFVTSKKDIAVMSVLLLSWSDTAASTFGRLYGHLTPRLSRNKSLAGSIAAFITGVLSSYLFYGYFIPAYPEVNVNADWCYATESSYLNLHLLSLLCGFVAAGSEAIDLFGWDDNFTIPVLSSAFLTGAVKLASKA